MKVLLRNGGSIEVIKDSIGFRVIEDKQMIEIKFADRSKKMIDLKSLVGVSKH